MTEHLIAAAGPVEYRASVEAVLASGEYDSLIVHYTPVGLARNEDVKAAIVDGIAKARAAGAAARPVLACLMNQDQPQAHLSGGNERVPCYPFPEAPARVLGKMRTYSKWRSLPEDVFPDFDDLDLEPAHEVCRTATTERGECWLSAEESWAVLEAAQLPLSPVALDALVRYDWPGNIRELANVMERAQILAEGDTITRDDLPDTVASGAAPQRPAAELANPDLLDEMEKRHVEDMLSRHDGNKVQAAKALGISRRSFYRLLEKYGLG